MCTLIFFDSEWIGTGRHEACACLSPTLELEVTLALLLSYQSQFRSLLSQLFASEIITIIEL